MQSPAGGEAGGEASPPILIGVVENRAKEVGMAVFDGGQLSIGLLQFIETSRSYNVTISLLEKFGPPSQMLVVNTPNAEVQVGLNHYTSDKYQQVGIDRRWFDDVQGQALLSSLQECQDPHFNKTQGLEPAITSQYLAVSAAGAVLHYVSSELKLYLSPGCLRVNALEPSTHLVLNLPTIKALELLQTSRPLAGANTSRACRSSSILHLLNKAQTAPGSRLLRASLLQPLTHIPTINGRLDAVEELIRESGIGGRTSADIAHNCTTWLKCVPKDLDRMCLKLSTMEGGMSGQTRGKASDEAVSRRLSSMITSMLSLSQLLEALPDLACILEPASSRLLRTIGLNAGAPAFSQLLEKIHRVIDQESHSARNTFMNHIQCCFAVQAEVDQLLDLSRNAFCNITEQIHELTEVYKQDHGINNLKAAYKARRGFSLVLPLKQPKSKTTARGGRRDWQTCASPEELDRIPDTFQVLEANAKSVLCTTQELNALNLRLREASNDCLRLTEQILEGLQHEIASTITVLRKLVDSIALLDVLICFADVASTSIAEGRDYTRPVMHSSATAPFVIVGGRHALLDAELASDGGKTCVSNDTYLSEVGNLAIVMGPNMSGKSTYLRQVGIIAVLAQIGCFVPATYASFSPFARITVQGVYANIEEQDEGSSFLSEMMETNQILRSILPRSLVLIDELGRSTSTADGLAVSVAVAETLASAPAFSILTTHFAAMSEFANVQPTVKLLHLEVNVENNNMEFTWKAKAGASPIADYGIQLAEQNSFPPRVIADAKRIAATLKDDNAAKGATLKFDVAKDDHGPNHEGHEAQVCTSSLQTRSRVMGLYHKLACLALATSSGSGNQMSVEDMMSKLAALKEEAVTVSTIL